MHFTVLVYMVSTHTRYIHVAEKQRSNRGSRPVNVFPTIWCRIGQFKFVQKDNRKCQPKLYINMKSVCFATHPSYYLTQTSFPFYNIPLAKDGIATLGSKIVFKKGNRYTCNNTCKVRMRAKIRNRYDQATHLTQGTNGNVSQLDITNESQEVSPFPADYHKALINRRARKHKKQDRNNK